MILEQLHGSFNSSFKVGDEKQPLHFPASHEHEKRRAVRFNEFRNEYFAADEPWECENDNTGDNSTSESMWYTDEDFYKFRIDFRKTSKVDKKVGDKKEFIDTLKDIYQELTSVDFMLEDADKIVDPELKERLVNVYSANEENLDFVGYEYIVSVSIKKNFSQRKARIHKTIGDIQIEFDDGHWQGDGEVEAEIRDCYRNFAQAGILLAQIVAKAQARAAR